MLLSNLNELKMIWLVRIGLYVAFYLDINQLYI